MEEKQLYTITVFAENKPGVLYRIADLFLRRKINIESLTVSETEIHGISRFTILIKTTKTLREKTAKQLYRIIEITKVIESTDQELIFREIAFIKVSTNTPEKRREVRDIAGLAHASILQIGSDFLVVEKVGGEEEINSLLTLLKPFGIKEFVRSGRIVVFKKE